MFFNDKDTRLAESRMEQLVNAIKQKNEDDLKEIFSEKAIEEVGDIESEVEDLLDCFQGEVVSWKWDGLPVVTDVFEYGRKIKKLEIWFMLETDEENYLVFFVDYPIDTITPENVGLYTIWVLRAEDEEELGENLKWGDANLYSPGVRILCNQT